MTVSATTAEPPSSQLAAAFAIVIFNTLICGETTAGMTLAAPVKERDVMRGKGVELILYGCNADKALFCEALVSAKIGN